MPALAHTSSLSPPGAPETPTAPSVSSPALIGSAPRAGIMLPRRNAPALGVLETFSANWPEGSRVRAAQRDKHRLVLEWNPATDNVGVYRYSVALVERGSPRVFPMVPGGKGLTEMILAEEL